MKGFVKQAMKVSKELFLSNLKEMIFLNPPNSFKLYWKLFKPNWSKRNKNIIKFAHQIKKNQNRNYNNCCIKEMPLIQNFLKTLETEYQFEKILSNQKIDEMKINSEDQLIFIKEFFFEFKHDQKINLKENFIFWKLNFSITNDNVHLNDNNTEEYQDDNFLKVPLCSTKIDSKKYFFY